MHPKLQRAHTEIVELCSSFRPSQYHSIQVCFILGTIVALSCVGVFSNFSAVFILYYVIAYVFFKVNAYFCKEISSWEAVASICGVAAPWISMPNCNALQRANLGWLVVKARWTYVDARPWNSFILYYAILYGTWHDEMVSGNVIFQILSGWRPH